MVRYNGLVSWRRRTLATPISQGGVAVNDHRQGLGSSGYYLLRGRWRLITARWSINQRPCSLFTMVSFGLGVRGRSSGAAPFPCHFLRCSGFSSAPSNHSFRPYV